MIYRLSEVLAKLVSEKGSPAEVERTTNFAKVSSYNVALIDA
jgi:hypothetical protein